MTRKPQRQRGEGDSSLGYYSVLLLFVGGGLVLYQQHAKTSAAAGGISSFGLSQETKWWSLKPIDLFRNWISWENMERGDALVVARDAEEEEMQEEASPIPFGTKTVYGNHTSPPLGWTQFCEKKDVCRVLHVNMLTRHGTRFPSAGDTKKFARLEKDLHVLFGDYAKEEQFAWLGKWKSPFQTENVMDLAPRGEKELYTLGKRTAKLYEDVLERIDEKYFSDFYRYQFYSTQTRRAAQSANAFAAGLFSVLGGDTKSLPPVMMESQSRDRRMRFFDNCWLYGNRVKGNKTAMEEVNKWEQSAHVKGVVERAVKRLGLDQDALDLKMVSAMYGVCAFEVAFSDNNRFCQAIFGEALEASEDHLVMEYTKDIKSYWQKGPGYAINLNMSALLLWDILEEMKKKKRVVGVFRFAHAETLIPVMNSLELFVDNFPLTSDGWEQEAVRHRQFRTSTMSPFAANIRLTVLKKNEKKNVLLEVNERVARVPGCEQVGLCDYSVFIRYMEDKLTATLGSIKDKSETAASFDLMCEN
eukprot:Nk52_evm35s153 gene=Nk52_evmTU35s153